MTDDSVEDVKGKALYEGQKLAEWNPEIGDKLVPASGRERVPLFGSVAGRVDGRYTDDPVKAERDLGRRLARFPQRTVATARSEREATIGDE